MAKSQQSAKPVTTSEQERAANQRGQLQVLQQEFKNCQEAGLALAITNAWAGGKPAIFVVLGNATYCEKCKTISQGAGCGKGCDSVVTVVTTTEAATPSPA